ncbi:Ku protein [Myxococcus stipitatus]|uniref:non-homologous end joining protein Ku n=1 Tax=Myxococcus stipitatus TaxID=83455 RepID=UPI001F1B54B4|nr:Ku protein [Myxococcus stipitatus]MCE9673355.1 Ku protein [Myxococcus stipitatus]
MSRPVWVGSLRFGVVTLPVRLHGAVASRQVRFHLLHDADGGRIQNRRVCSVDGEQVPLEHVVRGHEREGGGFVAVTSGELDALDPQASRVIELTEFVEPASVDPVLWDASYHLVPAEGAERAHALLTQALRSSGRAGVGQFVLRQKGHLCLVRPYGRGLVLTTLHYADEVVPQDALPELALSAPEPSPQELDAVLGLISAGAMDFDARRYRDTHRERVLAFLERRARSRSRSVTVGPWPRPSREAEASGSLRLRSRLAAREVRARDEAPEDVGAQAPAREEGEEPSS